MELNKFPLELLALIVSSRDLSFLVVNLWNCGNKILQSRLVRVVTDVHLEAYENSGSHFPLLLSQLTHMRYLCVKSPNLLVEDPTNWPPIVQSLTGTLETLCIETPQPFVAFTNFAHGATSSDPARIQSQYPRGLSHFFDVGCLFPRLETLSLGFAFLNSLDFPGLPSTLTRLHATFSMPYSQHQHFMSVLPRTLLRLEGTVCIHGSAASINDISLDWLCSPPKLEHVGEIQIFGVVNLFDDLSWLPRSLTDVKSLPEPPSGISAGWLRSLPPLIQSLSLKDVQLPSFEALQTNWIFELPRYLTSLNVEGQASALTRLRTIGQELSHLPRTLTRYCTSQGNFTDWNAIQEAIDAHHDHQWSQNRQADAENDDGRSFWPPNLTAMELPRESILPAFMHLLPRTLHHLVIGIGSDSKKGVLIEEHFLDYFPRLTSLKILINTLASPTHLLRRLPPGLTRLELRDGFESGNKVMESGLKLLVGTEITDFTLGLWRSNHRNVTTPLPLPSKLTRGDLYQWHVDWNSALPRSLTSLVIRTIEGLNSPAIAKGEMFYRLPPHLTRLKIHNRMINKGDAALPSQRLLSALPYLTKLSICCLGKFDSSMIRELPPSLRSLKMLFESIEAVDAPFIPPRLRNFKISVNRMVPFDWDMLAEYWPPRAVHNFGNVNPAMSRVRERLAREKD